MVKKIDMFEANDGKLYKTRSGAENHNKKIAVNEVKDKLGLDENEISEQLREISEINQTISFLLKARPDWTTWSPHQIKWIDKDLMESINLKITTYVIIQREFGSYGKDVEKELFREEGSSFFSPDLHVGEEYKVSSIENVDERTLKVIYEDKFTPVEIMEAKLNNKERLTEGEISTLVYEFTEVYREEGEDSRWSRNILSVIDFNDKLYAISWQNGLTENQENEFFSQPYEVELEEEEVTITKTIIKKVQ